MGKFITRIRLDERKRATQLAIAQPSLIHGAVEESLDRSPERKLWRIDRVGNTPFLLIVSESVPGTESLIKQFGDGSPADTRDYGLVLDNVKAGEVLKFRLEANPSRIFTNPETGKKKRVAHASVAHHMSWLQRKAVDCGFNIIAADETRSAWKRFRHGNNGEVIFRAVTFEGLCTVSDVEKFKTALTSGIGKDKAFGMGLMTVMRVR